MVYVCCLCVDIWSMVLFCFFFQAEDGIRDLVRSRGLGDVYKRQEIGKWTTFGIESIASEGGTAAGGGGGGIAGVWLSLIHI